MAEYGAIGLCGAHRTGKTTLAKAYADRWVVPFVETSLSEVYIKRGVGVNDDLDYAMRLDIQSELLERLGEFYAKAPQTQFITDRTPIDLAAYLMSYMPHNVSDKDSEATDSYIRSCFDITNEYFDQIVVVQPGIPLDETRESFKGACIGAWIEKLNYLIRGLVVSPLLQNPTAFVIGRKLTNLDSRVLAVARTVGYEEHQYAPPCESRVH